MRVFSKSDEFLIGWRFRRNADRRGSSGSGIHSRRYLPPGSWHQVYVKSRLVWGGSRAALLQHARYITHREDYDGRRERDQETVQEFGNVMGFAKEIGGHGNHYRIIIAPRRGDLLDMEKLLVNTVTKVQELEGVEFNWAGVIHRMKDPNSVGVYNQHAHIIVESGFGGSAMLRREFRDEARAQAQEQIDHMKILGIHKGVLREHSKGLDGVAAAKEVLLDVRKI